MSVDEIAGLYDDLGNAGVTFDEVLESRKPKSRRAVEPRRAKGMWVPTWLFWLWWVLVLLPSALLVYESVVGW